MRKLKLFFACLLMAVLSIGQVWATDPAAAGTTLFSEDFSSYAKDAVPSGEVTTATGRVVYGGANVTYSVTNGGGTTKIYTENLAGGTSPEILVGKSNGTLVIEGIPAGGAQEITVSYKQNKQKLKVEASGTGYSGSKEEKPSASQSYSFDVTVADGAAETFTLTFTCTGSSNVRVDDILVTVKTAGEGGGSDPVAVTGVSLDETAISLGVGENQTLTATVAPSDATNKAVSWESDDEDIATVEDGVVTGVAVGTATITVKTTDGNKTATCAVTVTAAPAASNWQVIAPENLATGDVVVLTMNVGGTYYAASNNNGTSNPPSATSVAVTGSSLSATPATTLQWIVTVVSEGVFQFSVGDNKLYCTDTNNGVRVGTDPTSGTFCNTFDIATENSKFYLHTTESMPDAENGRYVGVYNAQNWRCYTSVNNNIKGGSLVIFKENDNREAAGLDFATKQYLIKKNAEFTAPTLVNPNSLSVSYTSSNTDVAEVAANGAITIKADATGAATITASFGGDETYKDGSASYTIFVAEKAGTNEEGEILTEAIAKELIDLGCTLDVYVTGTILTPQYYDQSKTYTVTLTDGFQFYYFYAGPNEEQFDADILTAGDVLVAYGYLKKSGNNYRLNPCYMVSREPYSEPKVDISNTEATAYTPAQAITLYNDVTSDLTKTVYVKGVVVASPAIKYNSELTDAAAVYNGTYNVYVKAENDDSENPTKFEFFRMYADENNSTFEEGDIQVGDVIVAKGILSKYQSTYEFAQGCQMVSKKSKATMTFDDLDLVVDDEETLAPKTITLAQASAIVYTIKEGSDDCVTISGAQITATAEGSATIVATLATTDDYIGTSVEFSVTVTAAPVVLTDYYEKVTETAGIVEGTYLIVYEDGDNSLAFNGGLSTLDAESNTIAVTITNDNKIGVTTETAAATFYIDPAAGTVKSASDHYIGVSSWGNGLKQTDTYIHNVFEIDGDGNAQVGIYNANWNTTGGTMLLQYNKGAGQTRFRYFKNGGQQSIALYKLANETVKANPELAWSDNVEITIDGDFTAPTLSHATGITGTINYQSDNEAVATVDANGAISLTVPHATGTAHITATYDGDENFKAGSAVCTIKVNPAHSIYVAPSLNVNFGSVAQNTTIEDKVITVTLTGVDAATATLAGDGASAFEFTPAALTASGNITISASSATVGTFNATLTISDDNSEAESKVVTLKIIVTEPSSEETAISTSTQWVAAVAADLVDGAEVIITGVKDEVVYAMGEQKSTNRAAYVASVDGDGVLTPGAGTMSFTLVAQETEGVFALRTSNGKYLYAAASGNNHLKTQDEVDVNAKWTLAVNSAVATESTNRNIMRFNGSGENKLFSCYSSGQTEIKFYVPKPAPAPSFGSYERDGLTPGNYATICLPNAGTIEGAKLFDLDYYDGANTLYLLEVNGNAMVAGRPYIFLPEANEITVTYTDNAGADAGSFNGLVGSYTQQNVNEIAGENYILYQNAYYLVNSTAYVGANRAYIHMAGVSTTPTPQVGQAPRRRVGMSVHGEKTTTDIDALNASDTPIKMIIDGQLFIIRGEKMFDATGRLVK